jgi:hypothetical protein
MDSARLFDFHSASWVNLHDVLYGLALALKGLPTHGGGGGDLVKDGLETIDESILQPDERAALDAAVTFYAATYADRDPTFDEELTGIINKLSASESSFSLAGSGLPPALILVLERAMPVYRTHWWPEHDRTNRAWIASALPYVARYGPEVSRELERAYQVGWPREPVRVDVCHFVHFAGAATTERPSHIMMSSSDYRNQPPRALESLFHEASHVLFDHVEDALSRELRAQTKKADKLWHAVLFFSVGKVVERQLGAGYVPYATKFGLYSRGWSAYPDVLEREWTPYLDGHKTFEAAVHDVVADL